MLYTYAEAARNPKEKHQDTAKTTVKSQAQATFLARYKIDLAFGN